MSVIFIAANNRLNSRFYSAFMNPVFPGQFSLKIFSGGVFFINLIGYFWRNFSVAEASHEPPFFQTISHVVFLGA